MDGTESHLLAESSSSFKPPKHAASPLHSFTSSSPTVTSARLRSSRLSNHSANAVVSGPELVAPIPVRHPELQALDMQARNWPTSSSPASSSRALSPVSSPTRAHAGLYRNSLASLAEIDGLLTSVREEGEIGTGRRWIRWMHKNNMKGWVVPAAVVAAVMLKWCVGMGSYSGQSTPPMYGDYEAQRHWMELTIHLPVTEWYRYDLQYWGLDYPPLTAYVSWLCGRVGALWDPSWFALDASRGIETPESKFYMRLTVLVLDYAVYIPAMFMFTRTFLASRSRRTQNLALVTLLFQPALLLVDNGHFQYNSVMLGFTLFAINFFALGWDALGAFCFVCSLCFKQMALYYAPAIGMYLVGKCLYLGPLEGTRLLLRLGITTGLAFVLFFLPFLPPFAPLSAMVDPITRIFPFNRGIFEDKVANFWCASNVVLKWRNWASRALLMRLSTLLTLVGFLGAAIAPVKAWLRLAATAPPAERSKTGVPSAMQPVLLQALLNSAMSFFLFSFQVHEKTILVPLLPLTLLAAGATPESTTFALGVLANNVAVFSMWPLLRRDGLALQYLALTLLWNKIIGYNPIKYPLSSAVYAACAALHAAELLVPPPARYPDLYPVLNVLVSTPVFGIAWLWSIKSIVEARWAVGGLGLGAGGLDAAATPVVEAKSLNAALLKTKGMGSLRERGMRTNSLGYASGSSQGRGRRRTSSHASAAG